MKSAGLKILAFGGVALAAYPIIDAFRPDFLPAARLPDLFLLGPAPALSSTAKSPRSETALSLSPQAAATLNYGSSIIIRPDASGHFITKAKINGTSIPLIFDTGASIVALSYEDAMRLGIQLGVNDFRSQVQTANGLAPAAELTLREVQVDGIRIADVSAMVLAPGKLESSLLGRSFWGRLKTGFSYAAGNLILKN